MSTKLNLAEPAEPAAAPTTKAPSKSSLVLKLLIRARGATAAELQEPTGWQPHSVRAYLSGLRKQGRIIIRDQRKTGETVYRIVEGASLATIAAAETAAVAGETAADAEPGAAPAAAIAPATI